MLAHCHGNLLMIFLDKKVEVPIWWKREAENILETNRNHILALTRLLVSNSIYAKKDRNGLPSANQVISKDKPRCGHAVWTLRVQPPTSPSPALSAHAEPKSQGHCRKWHHQAESLTTDISTIGPKGWDGSVHCARNAGTLLIGSWLHANARLLEIQTANH